jgi:hypothetical protein
MAAAVLMAAEVVSVSVPAPAPAPMAVAVAVAVVVVVVVVFVLGDIHHQCLTPLLPRLRRGMHRVLLVDHQSIRREIRRRHLQACILRWQLWVRF